MDYKRAWITLKEQSGYRMTISSWGDVKLEELMKRFEELEEGFKNPFQLKRLDITGFTWFIFGWYIEFVFVNGWIKIIALNWKTRSSKTFYLLDIK